MIRRISWVGLFLLFIGVVGLMNDLYGIKRVYTERDGTFDHYFGIEPPPGEQPTKIEEIEVPALFGPGQAGLLGIRYNCGNGAFAGMFVEAWLRDPQGRVTWTHSVDGWVDDWDVVFAIGFVDVDGDGVKELLFADRPSDDTKGETEEEWHDNSVASPTTILFFRDGRWQNLPAGDLDWRARQIQRIAGGQVRSSLGPTSAGALLGVLVAVPVYLVLFCFGLWAYLAEFPRDRACFALFVITCIGAMIQAPQINLSRGAMFDRFCCCWGVGLIARKLLYGTPKAPPPQSAAGNLSEPERLPD
jgi:hypothetical protein